MDTISHSETGKSPWKMFMHQDKNAPFMTKNANFAYFSFVDTFGTL